jgi:hypothetical protein
MPYQTTSEQYDGGLPGFSMGNINMSNSIFQPINYSFNNSPINSYNTTSYYSSINTQPYSSQQSLFNAQPGYYPSVFQGQMIGGQQGYPSAFQGQMIGGQQGYPSAFQGQMIGNPFSQPVSEPSLNPLLQQLMQRMSASQNRVPFIAQQETIDFAPLMQQLIFGDGERAWGDPHFTIKNSKGKEIQVDHKGTDNNTYNILDTQNGDGLVVDAKYINSGDPNAPQVMGQARIQSGKDIIMYGKDGAATLNGNALTKGTNPILLADGTQLIYGENGNLDIKSKEKDSTIKFLSNGTYLDIYTEGKLGNGNKPVGGVLGTVKGKDGIVEDFNKDTVITDDEWAKMGYDFDVTKTRPIN